MARLIDADKLKVYLQEYLGYGHAVHWVDAQPTAYDVERVVAELKETNKNEVNAGMCTSGFIHCLTAIEIVRKGGVE